MHIFDISGQMSQNVVGNLILVCAALCTKLKMDISPNRAPDIHWGPYLRTQARGAKHRALALRTSLCTANKIMAINPC